MNTLPVSSHSVRTLRSRVLIPLPHNFSTFHFLTFIYTAAPATSAVAAIIIPGLTNYQPFERRELLLDISEPLKEKRSIAREQVSLFPVPPFPCHTTRVYNAAAASLQFPLLILSLMGCALCHCSQLLFFISSSVIRNYFLH